MPKFTVIAYIVKRTFSPLKHIHNAFFPLLKSEDIRGVTVRGFPVSIIFTGNSHELARFL